MSLFRLFLSLHRAELHPAAAWDQRAGHPEGPGILCGNGTPPSRLLGGRGLRSGRRSRGGDAPGAGHASVGEGGEVGPQFLPFKPLELGPHPDRHGARKQV